MAASRQTLYKVDRQSPLRELSRPKNPTNETLNIIQPKVSFPLSNNSSEDYSNSSTSIYEAVYVSATSNDKNQHKIEVVNIPPRKRLPTQKNRANNENDKNAGGDFYRYPNDTEFLYGFGTQLDTIREQKSETTAESFTRSKSAGSRKFLLSRKYRDRPTLPNSLHRKLSWSSERSCNKNSLSDAGKAHGHECVKLTTTHGFRVQPKTRQEISHKNPSTIHNLNKRKKLHDLRINNREPAKQNFERFTDLSASNFVYFPSLMPLYSSLQVQPTPLTANGRNFVDLEPLKSPLIPSPQYIYYKSLAPKMKSTMQAQNSEIRLTAHNSFTPKNSTKDRVRIKMGRHSFCNSSIVIDSGNNFHCKDVQQTHISSTTSISPTVSNYSRTALRRVPRDISFHNNSDSSIPERGRTTFQRIKFSGILTRIRCHRHTFRNNAIKCSSMSVLLPAPSSVNFRSDPIDPRVVQARSSSTSLLASRAIPLDLRGESADRTAENLKLKETSWKQKIGKSFCKIDHIWMQATDCLCFSCSNIDSKNI